ncbi:hypothetical protein LXA43DRAFT_875758 [Ganoderma leucocontextum]|nr:hypothetical protein LXA43DRAFT_875758 [Ganoderma leucocontextum]
MPWHRLRRRYLKDTRTWKQRLHTLDTRWQELLPRATDAFLRWKSRHSSPIPAVEPSEYDFEIDVLDLDTLQTVRLVPRRELPAAEALILDGYLAASPEKPTIAVSLATLEMFRTLRLVKPSLSVEGFTKFVCYKYCIPYRRRFRRAIADTFDVYLTIVERVRSRVLTALGRDSPNWRILHGCPACTYQVDGETPPTFARMVVMDGNNSLKRFAPVGNRDVGDTRIFESDYWLSMEFVNTFAGEVKARQLQPHVAVPEAEDDDAETEWEDDNGEGDPTDGAPDSACATNWKAAASDEKKRSWSAFHETGIFASCCRHGIMLWLIDMIRSGELAKLPLAIVAKSQELFDKLLIAFDIGCVFQTTVNNSSLGAKFKASGSRVCVNAFHGYSHSYPCQVQHHPNVITGIGIEDFETLERTFSKSNELAPVIRFASAYRRRALIHAFFQQYDEEKYTAIGSMLYDNYKQALEIIRDSTPKLTESLRILGLDVTKLKALEDEELAYFKSLRDEAQEDIFAVVYVEGLEELRGLRYVKQLDSTTTNFLAQVPDNYEFSITTGAIDYAGDLSATRKLERERRDLKDRIQQLNTELLRMEGNLPLRRRWEPDDPEYSAALKYLATRKYQQALGRLQRLVIQRLFELQKMNLSHTAYHIRTHLAKSLQKRCKAIRGAVKTYNAAALALDEPRPTLDWSQISHFNFLEEFVLLNDTRNDLRDRQWAQPLVRETMRTARRIKRATEEIENVHREAHRVHTSICDEDAHFARVLSDLKSRNNILFEAVNEFCSRHRANNAHILSYLRRLYTLPEYAGETTPGKYCGPPREHTSAPIPPSASEENPENHELPASHIPGIPSEPIQQPPPHLVEELARIEGSAVARDEDDDVLDIDEDEEGGIGMLIEHLANIAVVM